MELQQGQQYGVTAVLVLGSYAWRQLSLAAAFSLNEVLSQPSVTVSACEQQQLLQCSTAHSSAGSCRHHAIAAPDLGSCLNTVKRYKETCSAMLPMASASM